MSFFSNQPLKLKSTRKKVVSSKKKAASTTASSTSTVRGSSVIVAPAAKPQPKVSEREVCSVCLETFKKNEERLGTMHKSCHKSMVSKAPGSRDIPPLYSHQNLTKTLYTESEIVFDTSDPGTGKTRPALEAWWERRLAGGKCALVIAVKSNLDVVWLDEVRRWIPMCEAVACYATNREQAFKHKCDIYVTNTDAVKWIDKQPRSFFKRFDTLIIDESSYFKHRTSQRSKALNRIKKHFKYRTCMTGTPNSNTICDVWNQINILDDGKRLGKAFHHFRNSVQSPFQVGPQANHLKWEDKEGSDVAVHGLISDISIRHDFNECVDIPPNVERFIKFKLPNKVLAQYQQMEMDAVLKLAKDEVVGVNAAALRTKLLQIAAGAVYSENGVAILDTTRNELVMDLIEERKHSVVFFNWTHQRNQLVEAAEKRGFDYAVLDGSTNDRRRKEIVRAYQKGFYRTLFIHPKTGAHGLTLTKGTATIWVSPIYEPDLLTQGGHRIRRAGQTQKTETIFIQAQGTVEQKVFEILMGKKNRMISFLDMLKMSQEER